MIGRARRLVVVVVFYLAAGLTLFGDTALGRRVDQPIDTLKLTPHPCPCKDALGTAVLQAGTTYTLVISGLHVGVGVGYSQASGRTTDAFFLLSSTGADTECATAGNCPRHEGELEFGIEGHPIAPIDGSDTIVYNPQHVYKISYVAPFTGRFETFDPFGYGAPPMLKPSGGFTIDIYGSSGAAPQAHTCPAPSWLTHGHRSKHTAAINEVHVVNACPDVQFHKGGTPADAWLPLEKDTVLKAGDEITCDPDGAVTMAFADNSTVTVRNTTQLKIGSFFTEGGVVRTEILLKMGEVAAQVNKSEATKSDFRIKSPSSGAIRGGVMMRSGSSYADENVAVGSGGARFVVFLDPGTHALTTDVYQGSVQVTPVGGSPVTLGPGKEVEVVGHAVSPIAPIGKANARGGINRFTALNLVESKIGAERTPCGLVTPKTPVFSVVPATGGWTVSVKAVAGKAKGNSIWFAAGSKAVPKNAAAKLIAGGCTAAPHTGGGTHAVADTWSGTWARKEVKGNLILTQTGSTITGRYTWGDGTGKVSGPVDGSTFNGTFDETNYQGQFKLTISGRSRARSTAPASPGRA